MTAPKKGTLPESVHHEPVSGATGVVAALFVISTIIAVFEPGFLQSALGEPRLRWVAGAAAAVFLVIGLVLVRKLAIPVGPDRSFGLLFCVVFALLAGFQLVSHLMGKSGDLRTAAILGGVSTAFLGISLVVPGLLHPLNVQWMRLGFLLQTVVSPVVLGILFFLTVTPMGIVLRLMGKDLLRLKLDKSARSYWIVRDPPGPAPDSMRNQF